MRFELSRETGTGLVMIALIILLCVHSGWCAESGQAGVSSINPEAQRYYDNGLKELKDKKYDSAIGCFDKALKSEARYSAAYEMRAQAYEEKGDYGHAAEDFGRAADYSQPPDAELYHRQGLAYGNAGNFRAALPCFDRAIRLAPGIPVYYYDLAISENLNGDSARALDDLTRAIKLDDKYTAAYYARGMIYGQRAEYDAALADFETVIEALPKDYRAYYWRGKINFLKGNRDVANKDYAKANKLAGVELPIYSK